MSKMMDELKDAKEYAEKYKECYLKGDIQRANKYKEMAEDELKHAHYLREMITFDMECFNKNASEIKRMLE
jgi:hypothetical protein